MSAFPRPIHLAQQLIKNLVCPGDFVVDATLGNGHDALFLAHLVTGRGRVIGFDVQSSAIDSSIQRMKEHDIAHFDFHHTGHENMADYISSESLPLTVVMFNLGYLPNADKSIITTEKTTIPALKVATQLLKKGGLVSLMCYPGHEGGDVESKVVSEWAESLPRDEYRVAKFGLHNAPNSPPFLLLIEKTS